MNVAVNANIAVMNIGAKQQNQRTAETKESTFGAELDRQLNNANTKNDLPCDVAQEDAITSETPKADEECKTKEPIEDNKAFVLSGEAIIAPQILNSENDAELIKAIGEAANLNLSTDNTAVTNVAAVEVTSVTDVEAPIAQAVPTVPVSNEATALPQTNSEAPVLTEAVVSQGNTKQAQNPATETAELKLSEMPKAQAESTVKMGSANAEAKTELEAKGSAKNEKELEPKAAQTQTGNEVKFETVMTKAVKADLNINNEAPVFSQVSSGILKAFEDGKMEFSMKLAPESLGELSVKMVFENGKLALSIITENRQTSKLIQNQLAELQETLKASGVKIESATVENESFNNLSSMNSF